MNVRTLFSKAGAKSRVEQDDDLEDAFSELEAPLGAVRKAASADDVDDSMSESDLYEGESVTTEGDAEKKSFPKTNPHSAFTKAVLGAPIVSVSFAWASYKMSEWLEQTKLLEFNESNYASRVDLIVKVHGIPKAEEYIKRIPESFRGEIVYRTLLANCVSTGNVKKSEDFFNKMKSLFPVTCFSCNQLLLLYKRTDNKKISDVLSLMEKENIKPSYFTYHVLTSAKGLSNDISGMEKIVEKMKTEGVEPNTISLLNTNA
ncbi:PREDICTED: pentatricopeptide repeat-containing protein At1g80270, mitochondrial-like [Erythranthe guttata]|uniref:pentatricopeptide repeat-containing protein At1g80270, mitochondrial-like n=1 Tax=Erythranthe guttata TaxID=4155 RepID=UPI00064DE459|nr:PREDICTED: pentatricopeptide repeat-containing protein At1g80270, mitochondrial-like [Erythranthe guttata]|eukprot:XP_012832988.1 PREDICTED: pentatricopeptide repeat-containing protein At1g80270, mitochondrial-like [Erythranthe guttata]